MWTRKAAEQGYAAAQLYLGVMYRRGEGVPQDDQEAVKWYKRAAEQGDVGAQSDLGLMYRGGQGVPQDYVLAHKWLNLAAAQGYEGYEKADELRDNLAKQITPSQIQEAQRLAREFKPKKEKP